MPTPVPVRQDNRLLDLPLSVALCKRILGYPVGLADLAHVDASLAATLRGLQAIVDQAGALVAAQAAGDATAAAALHTLRDTVESMVRGYAGCGARGSGGRGGAVCVCVCV